MKNVLTLFLTIGCWLAQLPVTAQSLPVGSSVAEKVIRISPLSRTVGTKQSLVAQPLDNLNAIKNDFLSPKVRSLLSGFVPAKQVTEMELYVYFPYHSVTVQQSSFLWLKLRLPDFV